MERYQVAIIGGGPAGYTAAEAAGRAGLSVVLFEKNSLGGVCLNEGCIPTKTLLYSAKTYDGARGRLPERGLHPHQDVVVFGQDLRRRAPCVEVCRIGRERGLRPAQNHRPQAEGGAQAGAGRQGQADGPQCKDRDRHGRSGGQEPHTLRRRGV